MSAARDHINRLRAARGASPLPSPRPPLPAGRFNIWAEGYAATGERGYATRLAAGVPGDTFADAVARWAESAGQMRWVDLDHLTYWGCRLYDNEAAARKRYG